MNDSSLQFNHTFVLKSCILFIMQLYMTEHHTYLNT